MNNGELALVMSGGGARSAYQVGLLKCLAEHYPELDIPIITGVSAGAINAAYLANHVGPFNDRVAALIELWHHLRTEDVFTSEVSSTLFNILRWGTRLLLGGAGKAVASRSLLDTAPLWDFISTALDANDHGKLLGIDRNIQSGALKAFAITGSCYSTGSSVTWIQGRDIELWERAHRKAISSDLEVKHILASAALPFFFPAVRVDGVWYGDGGMRLTAPLSPAVHLGASRVLAISTRHLPGVAEDPQPTKQDYPPPAQVVGSMFNSMFLDAFDADALRLERINALIEKVPEGQRDGMRKVELLLFRPSQDLGTLANEYEAELPSMFRFMVHGLGTQETRSNDMLSLLMFQPNYLRRLIDMGYEDAEVRLPEIRGFLA